MTACTALPFPTRGRAKSSASVVMGRHFREASSTSTAVGAAYKRRPQASHIGTTQWIAKGVGTPTPAVVPAEDPILRNMRLKVSARRHRNASRGVARPTRPFHLSACGTRHITKVHPTPS